jgi:hypothetical protein
VIHEVTSPDDNCRRFSASGEGMTWNTPRTTPSLFASAARVFELSLSQMPGRAARFSWACRWAARPCGGGGAHRRWMQRGLN